MPHILIKFKVATYCLSIGWEISILAGKPFFFYIGKIFPLIYENYSRDF